MEIVIFNILKTKKKHLKSRLAVFYNIYIFTFPYHDKVRKVYNSYQTEITAYLFKRWSSSFVG